MQRALIDELMPSFDVRSRYARPVDGTPEQVLAAIRRVRGRDLPVSRALLWLRGLPALATGPPPADLGDAAVIDSMLAFGFALLGERERELALGAVGRFWRPVAGLTPMDGTAAFASFSEPGHAKAVMDFRALPAD